VSPISYTSTTTTTTIKIVVLRRRRRRRAVIARVIAPRSADTVHRQATAAYIAVSIICAAESILQLHLCNGHIGG